MKNMSYCRFENTYADLMDCYEALGDKPISELSDSEKRYAKKLIELCQDIIEDFEDEINED